MARYTRKEVIDEIEYIFTMEPDKRVPDDLKMMSDEQLEHLHNKLVENGKLSYLHGGFVDDQERYKMSIKFLDIRLVIANDFPEGRFENDDDGGDSDLLIENYVKTNINNKSDLETLGLIVDDFSVPIVLESCPELVRDICNGKAFIKWEKYQVDFHNDYYNSWIFIKRIYPSGDYRSREGYHSFMDFFFPQLSY